MNHDDYQDFKASGATGRANYNDVADVEVKREASDTENFKNELDDLLTMSEEPRSKLLEIVKEYLEQSGETTFINECAYSKKGLAIDAWGINEDEYAISIDLLLCAYINPDEGGRLVESELIRYFKRMENFYDESVSGKLLTKVEDKKSDTYQLAQLINTSKGISCIRLYLITNAITPLKYIRDNEVKENGCVIEYNVWDARRIMRQERLAKGKEPIIINFAADYNCTLPCIKMPDVSEHVSCYLTMIPGAILAQVYHKYHQQLLEMNVRTFLQFKGASNKGIRDTLIGHRATISEQKKGIGDKEAEPDMFFAYNNGISTTATEVSLNEDATEIIGIRDWQIVNGGQTTAVISAVMANNDIELKGLSSVYVPMKISVVKNADEQAIIVPKISRYANTQTAIKKSDFDINENYLVDLERLSREVWVLGIGDKPVYKWFFERTRGQYLDMAKHTPTRAAEQEFYSEFPSGWMFDKALLAKVLMAWRQKPDSVCLGNEKNFANFKKEYKETLSSKMDKNEYNKTIAKVILFKAIDAFYDRDGVSLPGYKAQMTAYTMSFLSLMSKQRLDLNALWREQCLISPTLYRDMTISIFSIYARLLHGQEVIFYKVKEPYTDSSGRRRNKTIQKQVPQEDLDIIRNTKLFGILSYVKNTYNIIYTHIMGASEGENVAERTKKESCWMELREKARGGSICKMDEDLLSNSGEHQEDNEARKKVIADVAVLPWDYWHNLETWNLKGGGRLSPLELMYVKSLGQATINGRYLTYDQAKKALTIIEKAKLKGWEDESV